MFLPTLVLALPCWQGTGLPNEQGQTAAAALFDGFEGDHIGSLWRPGDYGEGRFVLGAVVISKDFARSGTSSARITLREGNIEQRGDDGAQTERAELDSGKRPVPRCHALVGELLRGNRAALLERDEPL